MKKRIPVFSALLFAFFVMSVYKTVTNMTQMISLGIQAGSFSTSVFLAVVQAALMAAVAVMAMLVIEKPQMAKYGAYAAVAWGGWVALDTVRGIFAQFSNLFGSLSAIGGLIAYVPTVIVLVCWLKPAVNMLMGKAYQSKPLIFSKCVAIACVFVLCYAIRRIFGGNVNVLSLVVDGVITAVPMMMVYLASPFLYGAFSDPENTPLLTWEKIKTVKNMAIYLVIVALVVGLFFSCGGSGGQKGDGVNTCRNCGRKTSLVAGFGYCGTCYEGFVDWQNRTWKD